MKVLVCDAPGALRLAEAPDPAPPAAGHAVVRVERAGICGTDYHIYEGKHPFLQYPRVMGHELSGTVAVAGEGVDLAVGTRVVVNPYIACGRCIACRSGKPNCCVAISVLGVHGDGGFAELITVPAGNLYDAGPLPARDAAMVEFLAIGAHAVRRANAAELGRGSRALVVGAGPIGLGTAIFARIAGYRVALLDADAERLAFARENLGFDGTLLAGPEVGDAVAELTGGEGFPLVFDATGNTGSIEAAFAHVAHGGALVLVSVVRDRISFADPEFHKREMMLIGSRNATRADFDHVMDAIAGGLVPLDALATHATTLEGAAADLPRWAHEKSGLIKAIITVADA
ncbi:zinc-binding alcohol dehydrogenase family protein [Methylobrevis albus]|uniref:Zinc-binding alcohol dehydrogenase family protein n=1 Tax=Methylobrevis albus TaxID=2793297 RepID=A0A931I2I8_9HYPH|nr:zinc-binding alcohol dehydrogenase family protein [Methylobrevis albus]MBH0237703.1 zinc-binding alcohol dehydrogenase family protein [Methylobrevis albus]